MTIPLPVIIAGGAAALLLSGGTKKRRTITPTKDEDRPSPLPSIIDESMLDKYSEPSGEEAGDFDTKEDDVSLDEDDDASSDAAPPEDSHDPSAICEEFLNAIYVKQADQDEIPINKIAVEQTVIPAMEEVMHGIHSNIGGPIDADSIAPIMIVSSLNQLIPVCEWVYDEENYEFTHSDGERIIGSVGKDVVYGLFTIAGRLIDSFNEALVSKD